MRHMKALYDPYTDKEREEFRPVVHASVIGALRKIFSVVPDELLSTPQIVEYRQSILFSNETPEISAEFAHAIDDWWSTALVPTSNLDRSTVHFLDRIIPISAADYVPTDLEILLCKIDSPSHSPLDELRIQVGENRGIGSLVCVCARQSLLSTHKWLPVFADVPDIVFVLNLDDYDNPESMRIAFDLFHRVCTSSCFASGTAIHLLLNQHSSFASKLAVSPLHILYPDCEDGVDPARAIRFLCRRFRLRM